MSETGPNDDEQQKLDEAVENIEVEEVPDDTSEEGGPGSEVRSAGVTPVPVQPGAQVWARLLDDGPYLASISTM
jgi:hypothetical protein